MRAQIVRATWYGLGVIAMVLAVQGQAFAGIQVTVPAPEIDPSTLSGGFALLAAGVMIVRSRIKSK
jgi:hypothetical protein